jgi:hypothetical protein
MPKATEKRRPIAVLEHTYRGLEQFAEKNGLFLFEAVGVAWEVLKTSQVSKSKIREMAFNVQKG